MPKIVLIVEDDEFLRGLLNKKLVAEGFNVTAAVDGKDGIKKIKDGRPDLVLLDLILPNMDGFEVLQKIKEDNSISNVPVVILSNLDQKEDMEKGLKLGAKDYLIKAQLTPDEIVEKVKSMIAK